MKTIMVSGRVELSDGRPQVVIAEMGGGPFSIELDAHDAIKMAIDIIKVAQMTMADALLIRWSMKKAGPVQGPRFAFSLMEEFREFRNELEIESRNRQDNIDG